ncbi:hypothetical protein GX51_02256 [Blastomyces parvus]|uniref:Uncharacterized protein n=1 Tax=Blastomyces parvus TaxID=2060905 RepID=A0A2B7XCI3_9EURO|nr:hypothetical protein GX51_02256 [Blastomyces parvus]
MRSPKERLITILAFEDEVDYGIYRLDALCKEFTGSYVGERVTGRVPVYKTLQIAGERWCLQLNAIQPGDFSWWPGTMQWCRRSQVFIFNYDVTSREGFDLVSKRYRTILKYLYWRDSEEHETKGARPIVRPTRFLWPKAPTTFTCFPNLPVEIKLLVLRQCLVCPNPVLLPDPSFSGINVNVLLTCKFFYLEGSRIFWEQNTFTSCQPFIIMGDTAMVSPSRPRVVAAEEGRDLANGPVKSKFVELSSLDDNDMFRELVMDACEQYVLRTVLEDSLMLKEDQVFN